MNYINEDCIFCKIINKEKNAEIIYEDEKIISFLDIDPINKGHLLIVPKKHCLDLDDLDEDTTVDIMKFSVKATRILKRVFKPDGYSIMQMVDILMILAIIICTYFQDIKMMVLVGLMVR